MKIIHIITGLGDGGAERTLFKICKYDTKNEHTVISLKGHGKYFSLLKKLDIKIYCLDMKFFSVNKFIFIIKLLRTFRPHIVQTWLVHGDFIGGIAAKFAGIGNIVWNIRYSNFQIRKAKFTTILIIKLLAKLSFVIPKSIVVVSKRAKKIYEIKGYDKKKLKFIPNGYDLSILKPSKFQKTSFKNKFKIKKKVPLIGNVARYDPKKDHLNLLNALSLIQLKKINFLCILVGSNVDKNNIRLVSEIKRLKLSKNVKLLGQHDNILQVMNGLDLYVQSSSYGEGFPNVVAEAMACGTPCIVTDVGDASLIIDKTGWLIPPNNPKKLSKAIKIALEEIKLKKWDNRCDKARLTIMQKFDISKMIKMYNKLWNEVNNKN